MKTWKLIALSLSLGIAPAGAQSVAVRFDFEGSAVSAGEVKAVARPAPAQFANPEEAGLFVEVTDAEGAVTYSAAVLDPRGGCRGTAAGENVDQDRKSAVSVVVPAAEARELVLYRRTSDDPDTGRTALVRVSL